LEAIAFQYSLTTVIFDETNKARSHNQEKMRSRLCFLNLSGQGLAKRHEVQVGEQTKSIVSGSGFG
jgi:hypothetical protein